MTSHTLGTIQRRTAGNKIDASYVFKATPWRASWPPCRRWVWCRLALPWRGRCRLEGRSWRKRGKRVHVEKESACAKRKALVRGGREGKGSCGEEKKNCQTHLCLRLSSPHALAARALPYCLPSTARALPCSGACVKRLTTRISEEGGARSSGRRAGGAMSLRERKCCRGSPVPVPLLVVTGLTIIGLMVGWECSFWIWWVRNGAFGLGELWWILNSTKFICYLYRIYVSSIALLKCV
jgi:hypothetical protein